VSTPDGRQERFIRLVGQRAGPGVPGGRWHYAVPVGARRGAAAGDGLGVGARRAGRGGVRPVPGGRRARGRRACAAPVRRGGGRVRGIPAGCRGMPPRAEVGGWLPGLTVAQVVRAGGVTDRWAAGRPNPLAAVRAGRAGCRRRAGGCWLVTGERLRAGCGRWLAGGCWSAVGLVVARCPGGVPGVVRAGRVGEPLCGRTDCDVSARPALSGSGGSRPGGGPHRVLPSRAGLECNGVVLFDDGGEILPSGRTVPPPAVARRSRSTPGAQTAGGSA